MFRKIKNKLKNKKNTLWFSKPKDSIKDCFHIFFLFFVFLVVARELFTSKAFLNARARRRYVQKIQSSKIKTSNLNVLISSYAYYWLIVFLRISHTTSPINPKLYQVTPLQWRNPEKIALHSDVVFISFTV